MPIHAAARTPVVPPRTAGGPLRRLARRLPWLALLPLLAGLWVIGDEFVEDDNFRVVDAELYRAGQLRSDEWSESLEEHGYRSVLNLRGAAPTQPWYALERSFAAEHGLVHYDLRLSAEQQPGIDTMRRLLAIVRDAPKPLLIHCKDGADRSGLAAALYLYAIRRRPAAEARGQLSLRFGHFPWLFSRTGAMDEALAIFVADDGTPPG